MRIEVTIFFLFSVVQASPGPGDALRPIAGQYEFLICSNTNMYIPGSSDEVLTDFTRP
jgi:hypothetical protein